MKRFFLPLVLVFIYALIHTAPIEAAVSHDATTTNDTSDASVTQVTVSHTITGSDLLLVAHVGIKTGAIKTISSFTWNTSETVTQIHTGLQNTVHHIQGVLLDPTSGTHTLQLTYSHTRYMGIAATSYTGVDTNDASDNSSGTANNPAATTVTHGGGSDLVFHSLTKNADESVGTVSGTSRYDFVANPGAGSSQRSRLGGQEQSSDNPDFGAFGASRDYVQTGWNINEVAGGAARRIIFISKARY